jgi:opacity protein-like surface antigen
MRKLGLSLALLAGAAAPVAAQQSWQPEIGIRAGWTHFDDANSTTTLDIIDLPMSGGYVGVINPSALYGIIPLSGRFALEPSFGWNTLDVGGATNIDAFSPGLRLNIAIGDGLYAGVGATAYIVKSQGLEATQGGYEAAVGYRRAMGARLHGSAEFFYEKREQDNVLGEWTSYGLRLGMGFGLGEGMTTSRRTGRPAMESPRMWTRSIGVAGGWTLVSLPNQTEVTTFTLPFAGQGLAAGSLPLPGPSALSMLFPVGQRLAFEPSVDFHRVKASTSDAVTSYQIGARLNYAFNKTAYAAVGLEYSSISTTGISDKSRIGEMVGAGLRFPITNGIMGRTEFNYRTFDKSDVVPAGQAMSFVFGLLVPVK